MIYIKFFYTIVLEIRYHSTRFDRPTLYSYTKNVPVFSDCAIEIKSFPKARVQWAVAISSTRTKPLNLTVTMVDDNGRLLFRYPNRKDNGIIYRCSYSNEYITSPNYGFITARFSGKFKYGATFILIVLYMNICTIFSQKDNIH